MITQRNKITLDKLKARDYFKQIAFIVLLVLMAFLLHSDRNGPFENVLTKIGLAIVVMVIPLNQILRVKRIHIYNITIQEGILIKYQDLLREREITLPLESTTFKKENTNIRGCSKLSIKSQSITLNQYCNQYWTDQIMKTVVTELGGD